MKRVYAGHHKCASHWISSVVTDVCAAVGLNSSPKTSVNPDTDPREMVARYDFVVCDNYFADKLDLARFPHRGFHAIRDPRDILISQYYSHRDTHDEGPWLTHERAVLRRLPERDGFAYLICESPLLAQIFAELARWDYGRPHMLETTFERLTADPAREFASIFDFVDVDVEAAELEAILDRRSFGAMRKHNPGHYRDGRTSQWRSALTDELLELFTRRHGGLVAKLGYPPT